MGARWCRSGLDARSACVDGRPADAGHPRRQTIRIVVAHPDPVAQRRIGDLLGDDPDLAVVDRVSTPAALGAAIEDYRPAVCVIDASLPGGVPAATRRVTRTHPATSVVMIAMADDLATMLDAVLSGVSAYLIAPVDGVHLRDAVHATSEGLIVIPRHLAPEPADAQHPPGRRHGPTPTPATESRSSDALRPPQMRLSQ
jgi:two-component system, NarL family, response regulator DesR